jgi:uncharacterized protein (TIGR00369 family)
MSSAFADVLKKVRKSGDPRPLVEAVPYARFMGIAMEIKDGDVIGTLTSDDKLIGNIRLPALHGGALGALLESTAIFKLLWQEQIESVPRTINMTVQYLRSAKPATTYCRAVIARQGRRVANVSASAWQENEQLPVATAIGNFLLT